MTSRIAHNPYAVGMTHDQHALNELKFAVIRLQSLYNKYLREIEALQEVDKRLDGFQRECQALENRVSQITSFDPANLLREIAKKRKDWDQAWQEKIASIEVAIDRLLSEHISPVRQQLFKGGIDKLNKQCKAIEKTLLPNLLGQTRHLQQISDQLDALITQTADLEVKLDKLPASRTAMEGIAKEIREQLDTKRGEWRVKWSQVISQVHQEINKVTEPYFANVRKTIEDSIPSQQPVTAGKLPKPTRKTGGEKAEEDPDDAALRAFEKAHITQAAKKPTSAPLRTTQLPFVDAFKKAITLLTPISQDSEPRVTLLYNGKLIKNHRSICTEILLARAFQKQETEDWIWETLIVSPDYQLRFSGKEDFVFNIPTGTSKPVRSIPPESSLILFEKRMSVMHLLPLAITALSVLVSGQAQGTVELRKHNRLIRESNDVLLNIRELCKSRHILTEADNLKLKEMMFEWIWISLSDPSHRILITIHGNDQIDLQVPQGMPKPNFQVDTESGRWELRWPAFEASQDELLQLLCQSPSDQSVLGIRLTTARDLLETIYNGNTAIGSIEIRAPDNHFTQEEVLELLRAYLDVNSVEKERIPFALFDWLWQTLSSNPEWTFSYRVNDSKGQVFDIQIPPGINKPQVIYDPKNQTHYVIQQAPS